jgi:arylsulfatase A-like enzyme
MSNKKPNVVFVITDDQGYGDLGCTGNPIVRTPNIDALYKESVRFTDFHVGPTCAPTRAGLLTGHYHNSTGVWHTIGGRSLLRKNEVSLADVFRSNGYKTGLYGKWHLGDNYPYRPHDRGFKEAIVHGGGGIGQTPDFWGNDYFDDTYFDKGEPRKFEGYCTDVFFRLGMDFIQRHQEEPFLCCIPTNAPHTPLQVEEKYVEMYRGKVPEERARFYGMITNIDENVGMLRERLIKLGLAEHTILIFMTDNGTASGCKLDQHRFVIDGYNAGMRGIKSSPYEGGHRVPFFLHWPTGGYATPIDVNELTANVDFMPTLIELCGLEEPNGLTFDGRSLIPIMQGKQNESEERVIVTDSQRVPNPVKWKDSAVMKGKWRLINGKELYHIQDDPEQRTDLALKHPVLLESLKQHYEEWWQKVSSQFHEEIPISIGSDYEKVTLINSHDWRGDAGECAWNQGDIRAGKICNSYVEIYVESDGIYSFELRRWPSEEGRNMTEGIPGELKGWYSGGRAIPVKKASIKVGDREKTAAVTDADNAVQFIIPLKQGPAHLQTYLEDTEGNIFGAYYVYVTYLDLKYL